MPYLQWPTPGFYRVSSGFRPADRPTHNGIDIARNISPPVPIQGADIVAAADGRVCASGDNHESKGNWLEIDHGGGLKTRYMHNHSNKVQSGQFVRQGDVIAFVGSTGRSTGPHLHFEVIYNGRHVDPQEIYSTNTQMLQSTHQDKAASSSPEKKPKRTQTETAKKNQATNQAAYQAAKAETKSTASTALIAAKSGIRTAAKRILSKQPK